jgi:hypothetical protein
MSDGFLRRFPSQGTAHGRFFGAERRRANIEDVSQPVSGAILIAQEKAREGVSLAAKARERGLDVIEHPGVGGVSLNVPDACLSGIDFRLYDPRDLHPWADRLSFVFIETDDAPFLDGLLVKIDHGEMRKAHPNPLIRGVSAYLAMPSIELDTYLEDWTDLLLSWVRYFFVEDLAWRRRGEMQGFSDYHDVFLDVDTTLGTERAERATFEAILATFSQQAEHRGAEAGLRTAV